MRICCDIDGTLTNFDEFVLKYGSLYMKDLHDLEIANEYGYDLEEVFELQKHFMNKGYASEDAFIEAEKIRYKFWYLYYIKYILTPFKLGITQDLKDISKDHELIFTTARTYSAYESFIGTIARTSIRTQLALGGIKYNKIKFYLNDDEKIKGIKSLKPDLVIDDKQEIINGVTGFTKVICVNSKYNEKSNLDVERITGHEHQELTKILKKIK